MSDGCGTIGGNLGFRVRDEAVAKDLLLLTDLQRGRYLLCLAQTGDERQALERARGSVASDQEAAK